MTTVIKPDDPERLPIEALHMGNRVKIVFAEDGSITIQDSKSMIIKFDAKGRLVSS